MVRIHAGQLPVFLMKTLPLLLVLTLATGTAGVASETPLPARPGIAAPRTQDTTVEPSEVPPHRGMSKAQVRKLYGDPDNVRADPAGETWFYFFNRKLYMIPFYYARPRTAMLRFNAAGILIDFRYSQ
jgi:outer membrane protein assembly factor BamE (lipoprotein component of BamABCDE complex)